MKSRILLQKILTCLFVFAIAVGSIHVPVLAEEMNNALLISETQLGDDDTDAEKAEPDASDISASTEGTAWMIRRRK